MVWLYLRLVWRAVYAIPAIMEALWVTISVAVLSALIAVVIGTLAAIGIREYKRISQGDYHQFDLCSHDECGHCDGHIPAAAVHLLRGFPRGYGTLLGVSCRV